MGYDALYTTKNILAPFQYKYFAYQEKSAAHVNSVVFLLLFSQLLRAKVSPLHLYFQVLTRSKNAWTSLDKFLWTPWCSVSKQITYYNYIHLPCSIYLSRRFELGKILSQIRKISYTTEFVCHFLVCLVQSEALGHVRCFNILTLLQGFRIKIF